MSANCARGAIANRSHFRCDGWNALFAAIGDQRPAIRLRQRCAPHLRATSELGVTLRHPPMSAIRPLSRAQRTSAQRVIRSATRPRGTPIGHAPWRPQPRRPSASRTRAGAARRRLPRLPPAPARNGVRLHPEAFPIAEAILAQRCCNIIARAFRASSLIFIIRALSRSSCRPGRCVLCQRKQPIGRPCNDDI
jgi:hypothetical protein